MPRGYEVPYEDWGSVGEQLLGRGDNKRSTKTFIEDGSLAMFLGLVEGLPDMILNMGRRLYCEEFEVEFDEVTPKMLFDEYPEARELIRIHDTIIAHKGSQQGYLVDRYTGWASEEEKARTEKKKSPSIEMDKGGSSWK